MRLLPNPGPHLLPCAALPCLSRRLQLASGPLSFGRSGGSGGSGPLRSPGSGVSVEPWVMSFSDLTIIRPIGEGSFGRVSAAAASQ
jgi:hypothetical protein